MASRGGGACWPCRRGRPVARSAAVEEARALRTQAVPLRPPRPAGDQLEGPNANGTRPSRARRACLWNRRSPPAARALGSYHALLRERASVLFPSWLSLLPRATPPPAVTLAVLVRDAASWHVLRPEGAKSATLRPPWRGFSRPNSALAARRLPLAPASFSPHPPLGVLRSSDHPPSSRPTEATATRIMKARKRPPLPP